MRGPRQYRIERILEMDEEQILWRQLFSLMEAHDAPDEILSGKRPISARALEVV